MKKVRVNSHKLSNLGSGESCRAPKFSVEMSKMCKIAKNARNCKSSYCNPQIKSSRPLQSHQPCLITVLKRKTGRCSGRQINGPSLSPRIPNKSRSRWLGSSISTCSEIMAVVHSLMHRKIHSGQSLKVELPSSLVVNRTPFCSRVRDRLRSTWVKRNCLRRIWPFRKRVTTPSKAK